MMYDKNDNFIILTGIHISMIYDVYHGAEI